MSGSFDNEIDRLRRATLRGRLAAIALASVAGAAGGWLLFGAADARFAFEPGERVAGTVVLVVALAGGAAYAANRFLRPSREEIARRADRLRGDGRAAATGALSLATSSDTPLGRWLAQRSRDEAAEALGGVASPAMRPVRALRRAGLAILVLAVVAGALWCVAPEAVSRIASRLARPASDTPPWSRLRFVTGPAKPEVVYGGALEVSVEISGGAPESVECLVRDLRTGAQLRLPAFRESATRFTRRLENITGPVDFAFASGRARSDRTPVEVLYRPVILSGKLLVKPPAYMGLKATEAVLDATEIRVPEGSQVTLRLESNRDLASGEATFTRRGGARATAPVRFAATTAGGRTADFTWTARESGDLVFTVDDVRRTRSPKPLKLALRIIPDEAPDVRLASPGPLLLATPSTIVPVTGEAKDDHGLASVRLVRTLAGFRDRSTTLADGIAGRDYVCSTSLDLARIGAKEGQTLEVMLEAADRNPSLMGRGGSEVARIVIISEERYAELLRARSTLEAFAPRFAEIERATDRARKALEKLDAALASGDPKAVAEARDKAVEAHKEAALAMERLAADFPAFAMEKRLSDLARKNAETMRENAAALAKADAGNPEAMKTASREAAGRLGRNQKENEKLAHDAKAVSEAGKILEMAARFQKIYIDQKSLVKRFLTAAKQVANGDPEGGRSLAPLGETQAKLRGELDAFKTELLRRRRAMPRDFGELDALHDDVGAFLAALEEADPGSAMGAAATAAGDADSTNAFRKAELALSLLDGLMKKKGNGFCESCNGGAPRFEPSVPDVNETLAQMLAGLCSGNNPGEGDGPPKVGRTGASGWGMGGSSSSGYAMVGTPLPRNVPVMGPKRRGFDVPSLAGNAKGNGTERARPAPAISDSTEMKPEGVRDAEGRAPAPEAVPETYRDAVKRYFEQ